MGILTSILDEFDALCEQAEYAFWRQEEISHESAFIDILNFVKRHLEYRADFVGKFKYILHARNTPFEAVALCMKEFQWEELKEYVLSVWATSADPRDRALRMPVYCI